VPLLVYLGSQLDDKTPTRLFQKHRDQFVGWSWSDHGDPVEFEVTSPDQEASAHDVVLICALTSEVNRAAFPDALNGFPVIEVRPTEVSPRPTLLAHEQSLVNFGEQWRVALATAEARFPNARRWHLVASAPVTASIESGRAFVRDIHPPVAVYERTDHAYEAVLRVNE
jgi:hypothetical protein